MDLKRDLFENSDSFFGGSLNEYSFKNKKPGNSFFNKGPVYLNLQFIIRYYNY